jgi:hypothetical protein
MSVLMSQSSPTIRVLHQVAGAGKARRVSNRPFNDDGELYATGAGVAHGWSGLYLDRNGGLQVTIGNAEYLEGKNAIRLWNHSKDRSVHVEVPVRPVWYSVNDRRDMLVSIYLGTEEVLRLGFESGDVLAMQSTVRRKGARPPPITLAPVFLEKQVLPQLVTSPGR